MPTIAMPVLSIIQKPDPVGRSDIYGNGMANSIDAQHGYNLIRTGKLLQTWFDTIWGLKVTCSIRGERLQDGWLSLV